jgi:hypothetical protein
MKGSAVMIRSAKNKKKQIPFLGEKGGGSGFLIVFMFFFFTLAIFLTVLNIVKGQHRVAGAHRDQNINLQLADSTLDQILSKIRDRSITIPLEYPPAGTPTPTGIPVTFTVPVGFGNFTTTAKARIDYVRAISTITPGQTPTPQPVRDIEGNLKYQMDAVITNGQGIGNRSKVNISRGIKALFVVVNFGRYMSFAFENDGKSFGGGAFNGPYHCNGDVNMSGDCDWNNSVLSFSGGASNPFYDKTYTTVISGSFVDNGSMDFNSQANQNALPSSNGSYSILTNSVKTDGTWIDGARGGFAVNLADIPYGQLSTLSQALFQKSLLTAAVPTYQLQGAMVGAGTVTLTNNHLIDAGINGVNSDDWPVRINLSALDKPVTGSLNGGTINDYAVGDGILGTTAANAISNYHSALASQYGIIIFVNGDAAVWGKLPMDTAGSPVTQKKVTIVCTGNVQIIGDVLVSNSSYYTSAISSDDIDPNPLVDNPNNDAIAILAGGNVYVNPWWRADDSFFKNEANTDCNGDMRIDSFIYAPNGVTGGNNGNPGATGPSRGNQNYKTTGGWDNIQQFTFHGAITVETSGYLPSCNGYFRYYDPNMKYNLSSIIPSGTSITSWQEEVNPPYMP